MSIKDGQITVVNNKGKGETFAVDELDSALSRAFEAKGTYLIDCKIDKDEFVLPMLPPGGSMDDIIVRIGD